MGMLSSPEGFDIQSWTPLVIFCKFATVSGISLIAYQNIEFFFQFFGVIVSKLKRRKLSSNCTNSQFFKRILQILVKNYNQANEYGPHKNV